MLHGRPAEDFNPVQPRKDATSVNASCTVPHYAFPRFNANRPSAARVFLNSLAGLLVSAAFIFLASAALADTITLKNGDRLTGTVNQLAGGKLTLTTAYAG